MRTVVLFPKTRREFLKLSASTVAVATMARSAPWFGDFTSALDQVHSLVLQPDLAVCLTQYSPRKV